MVEQGGTFDPLAPPPETQADEPLDVRLVLLDGPAQFGDGVEQLPDLPAQVVVVRS
jgi:hypothetical protein